MGVRMMARTIAVSLAAVVLVLPGGADALPIVSRTAQCTGVAQVGAGETRCTHRFMLTDSRSPSDIESHANFHARTASGTVTVEWFDQLFNTVAIITCSSPGLYVQQALPTGHTVGGGPADLSTYPNCQRDLKHRRGYFATGLQTVVVTATVTSCWGNDNSRNQCPFHGYLILNPPAIPV
jgi:hypothetical protein